MRVSKYMYAYVLQYLPVLNMQSLFRAWPYLNCIDSQFTV